MTPRTILAKINLIVIKLWVSFLSVYKLQSRAFFLLFIFFIL